MPLSNPLVDEVADVVRRVGREAFAEGSPSDVQIKRDGSFVTDRDLDIQTKLYDSLCRRWPGIPLLGEEMSEAERTEILSGAERLWCMDPLDGTTNYTSGLPFYGISLALVEGGLAKLSVVYDPVRDERFTASTGGGAYLNGVRLRTTQSMRDLHCIACVETADAEGTGCTSYRIQKSRSHRI